MQSREQENFVSRLATIFPSVQVIPVAMREPNAVMAHPMMESGEWYPVDFYVTEDAVEANAALDILTGVTA
jgi:hypothetical protein